MSAAGRAEAERLRAMAGLDAWTRCTIEGCEWHVHLPATRCRDHGGPGDDPEYMTSDIGGVTYRLAGGDAFSSRETE